ncbi:hypothetical protein PENTCL1PPCAC_13296, partial [Pristionchus entomophagus]
IDFDKKFYELFSRMPETIQERKFAACVATYCHFEDKNGCKNKCTKWASLWLNLVYEWRFGSASTLQIALCRRTLLP